MLISNGAEMLKVESNVMGGIKCVYPVLLWDNENVVLVDTAFPGQISELIKSIEDSGVELNKVNKIIVTHHDIDHVGNIKNILDKVHNVKVIAYKDEEAYINGEKTPLKLANLEKNIDSLPEEMKKVYEGMKLGFEKSKANVDETLSDNEYLPYCGGIEIIHTPGHTLGHICLYIKESKILIAGDMLKVENGELVQIDSKINYNNEEFKASLKKLTKYDIESVVCYHGGLYNDNVNKRMLELAE